MKLELQNNVVSPTVTSLSPLKMADSLPLDSAIESVPVPIARQKTGPKGGPKSSLSDDVKLKMAQHISSDLDARHVLLIQGKRNKQHFLEEMLVDTNEYLTPKIITKATLNKWLAECIAVSTSASRSGGGVVVGNARAPRT